MVTNRWLWAIAILAGLTQLAGVHFGLILAGSGLAYLMSQRGFATAAAAMIPVIAACIGCARS